MIETYLHPLLANHVLTELLLIWSLCGMFVFYFVNAIAPIMSIRTTNFVFTCLFLGPPGWVIILCSILSGTASAIVDFIVNGVKRQADPAPPNTNPNEHEREITFDDDGEIID